MKAVSPLSSSTADNDSDYHSVFSSTKTATTALQRRPGGNQDDDEEEVVTVTVLSNNKVIPSSTDTDNDNDGNENEKVQRTPWDITISNPQLKQQQQQQQQIANSKRNIINTAIRRGRGRTRTRRTFCTNATKATAAAAAAAAVAPPPPPTTTTIEQTQTLTRMQTANNNGNDVAGGGGGRGGGDVGTAKTANDESDDHCDYNEEREESSNEIRQSAFKNNNNNKSSFRTLPLGDGDEEEKEDSTTVMARDPASNASRSRSKSHHCLDDRGNDQATISTDRIDQNTTLLNSSSAPDRERADSGGTKTTTTTAVLTQDQLNCIANVLEQYLNPKFEVIQESLRTVASRVHENTTNRRSITTSAVPVRGQASSDSNSDKQSNHSCRHLRSQSATTSTAAATNDMNHPTWRLITIAMELHFAPKFERLEHSVRKIQQDLAALSSSSNKDPSLKVPKTEAAEAEAEAEKRTYAIAPNQKLSLQSPVEANHKKSHGQQKLQSPPFQVIETETIHIEDQNKKLEKATIDEIGETTRRTTEQVKPPDDQLDELPHLERQEEKSTKLKTTVTTLPQKKEVKQLTTASTPASETNLDNNKKNENGDFKTNQSCTDLNDDNNNETKETKKRPFRPNRIISKANRILSKQSRFASNGSIFSLARNASLQPSKTPRNNNDIPSLPRVPVVSVVAPEMKRYETFATDTNSKDSTNTGTAAGGTTQKDTSAATQKTTNSASTHVNPPTSLDIHFQKDTSSVQEQNVEKTVETNRMKQRPFDRTVQYQATMSSIEAEVLISRHDSKLKRTPSSSLSQPRPLEYRPPSTPREMRLARVREESALQRNSHKASALATTAQTGAGRVGSLGMEKRNVRHNRDATGHISPKYCRFDKESVAADVSALAQAGTSSPTQGQEISSCIQKETREITSNKSVIDTSPSDEESETSTPSDEGDEMIRLHAGTTELSTKEVLQNGQQKQNREEDSIVVGETTLLLHAKHFQQEGDQPLKEDNSCMNDISRIASVSDYPSYSFCNRIDDAALNSVDLVPSDEISKTVRTMMSDENDNGVIATAQPSMAQHNSLLITTKEPVTLPKSGLQRMKIQHQSCSDLGVSKEAEWPEEILLYQECPLASPSSMSLSGLNGHNSSPRPTRNKLQVCCSPQDTFEILTDNDYDGEDEEDDDGDGNDNDSSHDKKYSQEEVINAFQKPRSAVIWSMPTNNAPTHDSIEKSYNPPASLFSNLKKFPGNNKTFNAIAQKIAQDEEVFPDELGRGDTSEEDKHSDTDGVTRNLEIQLPTGLQPNIKTSPRPAKTLMHPATYRPTTTIVTGDEDRYIELVHVGSAALVDIPAMFFADTSMTSSGDSSIASSDDSSIGPKLQKEANDNESRQSFLERFRARHHNPQPKRPVLRNDTAESKEQTKLLAQSTCEQPNEGEVNMSCHSSTTSNDPLSSTSSIELISINDLQKEVGSMEHDAGQIYEIVERYYHYHKVYNAGKTEHFSVPLKERLQQPLDQLLAWTMVAFEEIENDFLTSFHDKAEMEPPASDGSCERHAAENPKRVAALLSVPMNLSAEENNNCSEGKQADRDTFNDNGASIKSGEESSARKDASVFSPAKNHAENRQDAHQERFSTYQREEVCRSPISFRSDTSCASSSSEDNSSDTSLFNSDEEFEDSDNDMTAEELKSILSVIQEEASNSREAQVDG